MELVKKQRITLAINKTLLLEDKLMWIRMEIPKLPKIKKQKHEWKCERYVNIDPKHATKRLAELTPKFELSWENQLIRRERPAAGISQFLKIAKIKF